MTQKHHVDWYQLALSREGLVAGRAIERDGKPPEYKKFSRRHLRLMSEAGTLYLQVLNSTFLANTDGKKLVSNESLRTRLGQRIRIANYQYVQTKVSISCRRENDDQR